MRFATHVLIGMTLGIALYGCATGIAAQEEEARPGVSSRPAPIHFGVHAAGNAATVSSLNSQATRNLIQWDQVEPSRGLFRLKKVADGLNALAKEGVDVCVTLRCNSQWACTHDYGAAARNYDRKSSPPKDWQDWRNFVTKIVESFDGDGIDDYPGINGAIKTWQVDNEFAIQWQGSGEELVELMKVTYETIKAADPEATVITPGFFPVHRWALRDGANTRGWVYTGSTDQSREKLTSDDFGRGRARGHKWGLKLLEEAGAYFDALDIHIYATDFEDMRYQVEWVKRQFETYNLTGKEIWALEFAAPFHEFDEARFNRHVIQMQVAGFAAGLDRIYWSSVLPTRKHPVNFQRLSLLVNPGMRKTAAYNYELIADQLRGFSTVARIETDHGMTAFQFDFEDSGKTVWVAWQDTPAETEDDQEAGDRNEEPVVWTFEPGGGRLTEVGMVQPGQKKPAYEKTLSLTNGKAAIELSEDPVFIVRQP